MEVASPLTFGHVKAGSKRRFACSPLDAPAAMDTTSAMDDSSAFHAQNFKRRRCGDTEMGNHNNNGGFTAFGTASASPFVSPFGQSQALSISTSIGEFSIPSSNSIPVIYGSIHELHVFGMNMLAKLSHMLKSSCDKIVRTKLHYHSTSAYVTSPIDMLT